MSRPDSRFGRSVYHKISRCLAPFGRGTVSCSDCGQTRYSRISRCLAPFGRGAVSCSDCGQIRYSRISRCLAPLVALLAEETDDRLPARHFDVFVAGAAFDDDVAVFDLEQRGVMWRGADDQARRGVFLDRAE